MNIRLCVKVLLIGWAITAFAQRDPTFTNGGRLTTFDEGLRSHNIETTRPAVIEALRNVDPAVRSLAAQKLAQDNARDAVPALQVALAAEKIPITRVDLGYALAKMGEEKGQVALQDVCQDSNLAPHTRVTAARFMLSLGRENSACSNALIDVIERGETGSRAEAAALLPQFHELSPGDSERALQALLNALAAKELVVRHSASQALGLMGNKSTIPYLQNALANEPDEFVRLEMRADLKKLQDKNTQ